MPPVIARAGPVDTQRSDGVVAPVAIRATAACLPDSAVEVGELAELAELPAAVRETCLHLGIDEVRADDELTAFDLAVRAAQRVLDAAGVPAGDVGGLVVVEPRVPEAFLTSTATRIQAVLGADAAVTFSVGGLGCGSITPALLAARGLLAADRDVGSVLVVHGSKPATPRRYRHPVTVSGDGGLAVLLARQGPVRVLDMLQETSGEYWDLFGVTYRDRPSAQWREECRDVATYSLRLAVETGRRLVGLRERILARNGLRPDDIGCLVSQNLSVGAFRFVEEALGMKIAAGCADNLRQYGHLGPADVLLNLHTETGSGRLADGQRALLLNVSPVAAWSLVLVEVGDGRDVLYL
jgi:3-oxoacyl-[acyl-carrier-protein] synthase-3